ncbi:hypothetical protein C8J56DRAFT_1163608 [Mycena floridula]|nr:hypothetical protein C8J56DRAFT_1031398 [Mycena floridula]KAJ7589789.1 hypothetical protein C8J56DRAFT_1163608 [Mycena floridula]
MVQINIISVAVVALSMTSVLSVPVIHADNSLYRKAKASTVGPRDIAVPLFARDEEIVAREKEDVIFVRDEGGEELDARDDESLVARETEFVHPEARGIFDIFGDIAKPILGVGKGIADIVRNKK